MKPFSPRNVLDMSLLRAEVRDSGLVVDGSEAHGVEGLMGLGLDDALSKQGSGKCSGDCDIRSRCQMPSQAPTFGVGELEPDGHVSETSGIGGCSDNRFGDGDGRWLLLCRSS
jgi:hypothetical protein